MGWNGSGSAAQSANRRGGILPPQKKNAPSLLRGVLAGLLIVAALAAALYVVLGRARTLSAPQPKTPSKSTTIKEVTPVKAPAPLTEEQLRIKKVKSELNESVKEFITKPLTGSVVTILGPKPLDPDDPDNIFRTRLAQDVAGLLAIEPGEPVPPILPFYFMFEDAEREACENEGREFQGDGGNTEFLESLKKWKIAVNEKDSDAKAAAKQNLLDAQIDILKNMDDGMTVNDSIRAAYEFRVKAAETRTSITEAIKEIYDQEKDAENTKGLIAEMNKKLKAEGIKAIEPFEVFGDEYEDPGEEPGQDDKTMQDSIEGEKKE